MFTVESQNKGNIDAIIIKPNTEFNTAVRQAFTEIYKPNPNAHYTLNFENLLELESSGVGMLLSFYDYCHENATITINNCCQKVLNTLYVSCLYRLFYIPQINSNSYENANMLNKIKSCSNDLEQEFKIQQQLKE